MRVDMVRVHTGCSLLLVVVERLPQTLDFPLQLASPGFAMTLYCSGSFSLSSESSTMSSLVVAVELPCLISCYSNSDFVLSRRQVLGEAGG